MEDSSRVFDAIEGLRKDMQTGFAQIQASIAKVENDGRENAIAIGRQDERMKQFLKDLEDEKERAKENANKNTETHREIYDKVNSLNVRTILISAAIAAASGGGGSALVKLFAH